MWMRVDLQDTARLENSLPEVTALAFYLQEQFNEVLDIAEKLEVDEEDEELANKLESKAFIINELCKLTLDLDYADEVGRRKTFQLARAPAASGPYALEFALTLFS
jgi:condensin complex subunit 3